MVVPVMGVGIMRMGVREPFMRMEMGMRFTGRIVRRVLMLVMLVVDVQMFVLLELVNMRVLVAFGEVEPYAGQHENTRRAKPPVELPLPDRKGKGRTRKRGGGKIGAGAGCAEMPQCPDK